MKYTRYDLKRDNGNKAFIAVIFLILVLAFLFGTVIFKLFIKSPISSDIRIDSVSNRSNQKADTKSSVNLNNSKITKFVAIQGGIYQSKENADAEKNLLAQYGTPFTVIEDNKTRVFLGIYTEEQAERIMKSLIEQKVDNSKMTFTLNNNDLCDAEIAEIINANIQILNKLAEKNVKSIQTEDLKKWCIALKKVDKDSKNILILKDVQDRISKMPKELTKENVTENYTYLYSILKKIGSK